MPRFVIETAIAQRSPSSRAQLERPLVEGAGRGVVAVVLGDDAEVAEQARHALAVVEAPADLEALPRSARARGA